MDIQSQFVLVIFIAVNILYCYYRKCSSY